MPTLDDVRMRIQRELADRGVASDVHLRDLGGGCLYITIRVAGGREHGPWVVRWPGSERGSARLAANVYNAPA